MAAIGDTFTFAPGRGACTTMPSPRYSATCVALGKYTTRSPGRSSVSGTRFSRFHCSWLVSGTGVPASAQACEVRPEQSYVSGPSAPHSYGLPSCRTA
ncbi:hypothetical protein SVIOM74S_06888 [Streptomyces violarus]